MGHTETVVEHLMPLKPNTHFLNKVLAMAPSTKSFLILHENFLNFSPKNFLISILFSGSKLALLLENRTLLDGNISSLSRKCSNRTK